jgi:prepilin-type processing-associated H-X9-DG protein
MKRNDSQNERGFTRADLVAILAIVAALALLGAQKLTAAGAAAGGSTCTGNMGLLLRALHLYTSDNADYLPFMSDSTSPAPGNWLAHNAYMLPDATNSAKLINPTFSMLAPYLNGNATVFKCPADPTMITVGAGGRQAPRVRSVSMSQAVGTNPTSPGGKSPADGRWLDGGGHSANRTYRNYARLSDVVNPRPQNLFIFLDEHPDSINDAAFGCMGPHPTASGYQWIDWVATYHNKGAGFGFADGHGEIHIWSGAGIIMSPPSPSTTQQDLHWLATRVSAPVANQP